MSGESTDQFKKFKELAKKVISVPKEEINKREEEWKEEREKLKRDNLKEGGQ